MNFDGAQLPLAGEGPYALKVPFCFLYAGTSKVGATTVSTAGMNDAEPPTSTSDMNNLVMMTRALGAIDRGEMARLLRAATVGFFDHHLEGRCRASKSQPASRS